MRKDVGLIVFGMLLAVYLGGREALSHAENLRPNSTTTPPPTDWVLPLF
jgi:hypothetical protein